MAIEAKKIKKEIKTMQHCFILRIQNVAVFSFFI